MAEVMTVIQTVQVGVETTHGTAPAGGSNKLLTGLKVQIDPDFGNAQYAASGHRFDSVSVPTMEKSKLKGDGPLTYTELVYLLSGLWGDATITTPTGATNARQWKWAPSLTGAIDGHTFQIQQGSSVQARQVNYGTWTDATLTLSRKECTVSAAGFGQQVQDGVALTASPTAIGLVPIQPLHWNVYLDTTSSGIGGTQLTRCFNATIGYTGAYNDIWPMDRSKASFAATVNAKPAVPLTLSLAADSSLSTIWASARAAGKVYIRFEALGDKIETGTPDQFYKFTIDVAAVPVPDAYSDDNGDWVQQWSFKVVEDDAWTAGSASGTALVATLINTLTTL